LFALSLPLLAAELARVVARLVFATMTAIVMVVDVNSAIFDVVFVVVVRICVFLLIPTLALYEIRNMNLPDLPGVSR
jgi:hypothetical protein